MYYWVRYQREHQCTLTMCLFTQWSLLCYFYPSSVKRYDQFNITVFSVWLIKNSESENIKFLTIKSLFISSANDDHSLISQSQVFPKVDVSKGFHHIFDMIWFTVGLSGYEHQYTKDCTRSPPAWHPRWKVRVQYSSHNCTTYESILANCLWVFVSLRKRR